MRNEGELGIFSDAIVLEWCLGLEGHGHFTFLAEETSIECVAGAGDGRANFAAWGGALGDIGGGIGAGVGGARADGVYLAGRERGLV